MALNDSHLALRTAFYRRRNQVLRPRFSIIPTLLAMLALVNVASAVFALIR